jgi:hypothetical protein
MFKFGVWEVEAPNPRYENENGEQLVSAVLRLSGGTKILNYDFILTD